VKIYDSGYDMVNKIDEALKLKLKDEFVHGFMDENGIRQYPTIQLLSKRHDVAYASLHRRSQSEDWQSQKNKVQTEYENAVTQERLQKMVDYGSRLDDDAIKIALAMLGDAGRRINQDIQNRSRLEAIARMESGPARDAELERFKLTSKVLSPHDMSGISHAVSNAQRIGKLALGQAQEISKVSANVTAPDSLREVIEELDKLAATKSRSAQHTLQ
jgi:hypothetical protein